MLVDTARRLGASWCVVVCAAARWAGATAILPSSVSSGRGRARSWNSAPSAEVVAAVLVCAGLAAPLLAVAPLGPLGPLGPVGPVGAVADTWSPAVAGAPGVGDVGTGEALLGAGADDGLGATGTGYSGSTEARLPYV